MIVAVPTARAIVALVALTRNNWKFSAASGVVSSLSVTRTVLTISPGAKVSVSVPCGSKSEKFAAVPGSVKYCTVTVLALTSLNDTVNRAIPSLSPIVTSSTEISGVAMAFLPKRKMWCVSDLKS